MIACYPIFLHKSEHCQGSASADESLCSLEAALCPVKLDWPCTPAFGLKRSLRANVSRECNEHQPNQIPSFELVFTGNFRARADPFPLYEYLSCKRCGAWRWTWGDVNNEPIDQGSPFQSALACSLRRSVTPQQSMSSRQ